MTNKDIKSTDLLSGDRNAVMVGLRTIGYGADYEVSVSCPECDHQNETTFNLTNVPIKSLELQPMNSGENYLRFVLPVSKKTVGFKFLTGKDEEDMSKTQSRKKKKGFKEENLITQRLIYSIVSIDDETDRAKLGNMIRNMLARDSLALRRHIDKNEPGIDLSDYMICDVCGEESKVNIPLGMSFFWPDTGA
jgi:RNA polymerase-binding transcription factor DksA